MVIMKVKEFRLRKGMSGRQLAEKARVSTSQISRIENNQQSPTIDIVFRIAEALDVDIKEICDYVPDDPPNNS